MDNRDIIMFGLQPWDIEIGSNFKNIAEVMSRHNRILYVNRPLDRITYMRNRNDPMTRKRLESIRDKSKSIEKVADNIWVLNPGIIVESINMLPRGPLYRFLNKRNSKRISKEIKAAVEKINFKMDILMVDNDFFHGLYLKELLKPVFFLYYLRDYLRSQSYFQKHGESSEPAIIKKADAVASNSIYLNNYAKKYNDQSYYVGQGCDVEIFLKKPGKVPEDIRSIPSPIVGYCGTLTSNRLDIPLLEFIADSLPEFNIVLVGPEDEQFKNSRLHTLKNVYFLGHKDAGELPAYVHKFDICINPQLLNEMTIGNYPRKIDEYLAAGKPTVATKTEAMLAFEGVVYLCENNNEYISRIRKAFKERFDEEKIQQRIAEASGHTWDASVELIYNIFKN